MVIEVWIVMNIERKEHCWPYIPLSAEPSGVMSDVIGSDVYPSDTAVLE